MCIACCMALLPLGDVATIIHTAVPCGRLRLADIQYLRSSSKDGSEHAEHSVVFLVDAAQVAQPDADAQHTLKDAGAAARIELEAQEVRPPAALLWSHSLPKPQHACAVSRVLVCTASVKSVACAVWRKGACMAAVYWTRVKRVALRVRTCMQLSAVPDQALEAAEAAAKQAEAAAAEHPSLEAPGEDAGAALEPSAMTVAALQEELAKRGLDTKWNPLKKKKELVSRLQARFTLCPPAAASLLRMHAALALLPWEGRRSVKSSNQGFAPGQQLKKRRRHPVRRSGWTRGARSARRRTPTTARRRRRARPPMRPRRGPKLRTRRLRPPPRLRAPPPRSSPTRPRRCARGSCGRSVLALRAFLCSMRSSSLTLLLCPACMQRPAHFCA